jgi:hypothetical protein
MEVNQYREQFPRRTNQHSSAFMRPICGDAGGDFLYPLGSWCRVRIPKEEKILNIIKHVETNLIGRFLQQQVKMIETLQ